MTGSPGEVHTRDIVDYVDSAPERVDCVTARALAPLKTLMNFAEPIVRQGATALFLKGQDVESELREATKYWDAAVLLHRSCTNPDSRIAQISRIVRRSNFHAAAR